MTINFEISTPEVEEMVRVFDPNHEVWKTTEEVKEEDVSDMLKKIFSAWLEEN